ncbi:MAG: hypothetical protein P8J55_03270 [Pseudomonadales bacterium]|jgi:hypothetical protein|nr:hypothetical protein [Pseudomonadales bacterium]
MELTKLVEYFIPDEVRDQSINDYFRGRILVVSSAAAFVCRTVRIFYLPWHAGGF